jgi:hypothetical protein
MEMVIGPSYTVTPLGNDTTYYTTTNREAVWRDLSIHSTRQPFKGTLTEVPSSEDMDVWTNELKPSTTIQRARDEITRSSLQSTKRP